MKLDTPKTDASSPVATQSSSNSKRSVFIYIFLLFLAALLMMSLSLLLHQRVNIQALDQLQNSVYEMQEIQVAQNRTIALQEELVNAQNKSEQLTKQLQEAQTLLTDAQHTEQALLFLLSLEQSYTAQDIDTCKNLLQSMKDLNLPAYLPTDTPADGLSPADLYQQLKEAILNM